ncbi:L-histidine N(alpha)-methyltransferase [Myxosarcina sp. GI1]|uniref:L-histidine N(alpha)-methyltransferase n=1 Tax=Myxosarcina sp. GI1 TaxID=1541065 RepID=UPI00056B1A10|nr:L-histidine N(alpha)-methyltransferase [Myxosarcina sp. GI1]
MSAFQEPTGDKLEEHPLRNRNSIDDRLHIERLLDSQALDRDDVKEVVAGFTSSPKTIPSRYFYDSKGSQLFEEICQLREYYPTRTEAAILEKYAAEIARITRVNELIELGSGSSTKTRLLLNAYSKITGEVNSPACFERCSSLYSSLLYVPIDVSGSILQESAARLLTDYPNLKISGKVATYQQALEQLSGSYSGNKIIVFLGSSIGNFNRQRCDRFIEQIKNALNIGDYFLLGIDLQKSPEILTAAYNDERGITAAFNLNMLQHLNSRFAGNFEPNLFEHRAIYNTKDSQIEMYLICKKTHSVNLTALNLTINVTKEEKILTEISRKFDLKQMSAYLQQKGLSVVQNYTDSQQWFGLILCQKI